MLRPMDAGVILADKYQLGEPIGRGAMGTVYRAVQLALGREVAVKVLHGELIGQPGAHARFVREAKVAAQLRHPASVQVIDFGEHDGAPYLVMELLAGRSLRAALDDGVPAQPMALTIGRDVAAALAAAHDIGLVHGDIKPENILLTGDGADGRERARVVDFGLAFIDARSPDLGRMTDAGTLGGTPAYMSPEQIRGSTVGPACDVYALGCTLYELLCGEPPFLGHVGELLTRHTYTAPTPLGERTPPVLVPAGLDDLVMRMLSKSPPLRPPAREVADTLGRILGAPPTSPSADRASRALRGPTGTLPPPLDSTTEITVAVCGSIDDELELGLVTDGFRVDLSGDVTHADVVLWAHPELDLPALARARATAPVVALVPDRLDALLAALRAGVDEAAAPDAGADAVAPLLRRALRHGRGRASPGPRAGAEPRS
jgi:serine/threonine protein kinase